jgi:hypothetical protein
MRPCASFWNLMVLRCVFASFAIAADVTGAWKVEFTTPDGTQRVNTFLLKMDGEKVIGTVVGTQDGPFGTFKYQGKIASDAIAFVAEFNDNKFEMTAKRVK